jgi:hypothetical protein
MLFSNGCAHGIQHSEVVMLKGRPPHSVVRSSVSVLSISRAFALVAALAVTLLLLLLAGCMAPAQKGGRASSTFSHLGHTNATTLAQSENPKEPSRQVVESEQRLEYVLPEGSAVALGASATEDAVTPDRPPTTSGRRSSTTPSPRPDATARSLPTRLSSAPVDAVILERPMPVRVITKDRAETSIGGAQRDTLREWSGKTKSMQPVMWAGIAMMTLVAGALGYFGWWTKAGIAVAVGVGMVVLAETLPDHGTAILLGGFGVFALIALLVLYAYHKGMLDKNQNGIPDFLEKDRTTPV